MEPTKSNSNISNFNLFEHLEADHSLRSKIKDYLSNIESEKHEQVINEYFAVISPSHENHDCSICLEGHEKKQFNKHEILLTQCGHIFHNSCAQQHISAKQTCPLCVQKVDKNWAPLQTAIHEKFNEIITQNAKRKHDTNDGQDQLDFAYAQKLQKQFDEEICAREEENTSEEDYLLAKRIQQEFENEEIEEEKLHRKQIKTPSKDFALAQKLQNKFDREDVSYDSTKEETIQAFPRYFISTKGQAEFDKRGVKKTITPIVPGNVTTKTTTYDSSRLARAQKGLYELDGLQRRLGQLKENEVKKPATPILPSFPSRAEEADRKRENHSSNSIHLGKKEEKPAQNSAKLPSSQMKTPSTFSFPITTSKSNSISAQAGKEEKEKKVIRSKRLKPEDIQMHVDKKSTVYKIYKKLNNAKIAVFPHNLSDEQLQEIAIGHAKNCTEPSKTTLIHEFTIYTFDTKKIYSRTYDFLKISSTVTPSTLNSTHIENKDKVKIQKHTISKKDCKKLEKKD